MSQSNKKVTVDFLQSFADAFNAHDIKAVMSHMTVDCVFEASAGPDADGEKFTGQDQVKKAFENVFANFRLMPVGIIQGTSLKATGASPNGLLPAQNQMEQRWRLPAAICLPLRTVK